MLGGGTPGIKCTDFTVDGEEAHKIGFQGPFMELYEGRRYFKLV